MGDSLSCFFSRSFPSGLFLFGSTLFSFSKFACILFLGGPLIAQLSLLSFGVSISAFCCHYQSFFAPLPPLQPSTKVPVGRFGPMFSYFVPLQSPFLFLERSPYTPPFLLPPPLPSNLARAKCRKNLLSIHKLPGPALSQPFWRL